jgi:hypothetical protein
MFNSRAPLGRQRIVNQVRTRVAAANAAAQAGDGNGDDDDDLSYLPSIGPGQMQLYSYFGNFNEM